MWPGRFGPDHMRYLDNLGKRRVSLIGLGTTSPIFGPGGDDRVDELIATFLDAGGNCIDTAHIYGMGESEKALARWLERSGRRDDVFLVTKGCHPRVDDAGRFGPPGALRRRSGQICPRAWNVSAPTMSSSTSSTATTTGWSPIR